MARIVQPTPTTNLWHDKTVYDLIFQVIWLFVVKRTNNQDSHKYVFIWLDSDCFTPFLQNKNQNLHILAGIVQTVDWKQNCLLQLHWKAWMIFAVLGWNTKKQDVDWLFAGWWWSCTLQPCWLKRNESQVSHSRCISKSKLLPQSICMLVWVF